jgi:menaquinone-9 beta-reductase
MPEQFDVIVVGARCAGSPLATLLARAGLRVCVLDRARFPSDTPSTHGIQPAGVKVLERLGVLDRLLEVAPRIDHGTLAFDDARIGAEGLTKLVGAPMVNCRRVTLDALLLDAAADAGAEIRTQTAVGELLEEGGRVVGVRAGEARLRAPLVVGADGARSTVARLGGAREYHRTAPGRAFLWGYFEGSAAAGDGAWLGRIGDDAFLASPTDGDLTMAAVALPVERWERVRGDREAAYAAALRGWPELHAALAGARRVGPLQAMPNWRGFFRASAGPGWVLVGDAGHFKDPTPGQGIADALRQVVELSAAIQRALGGGANGDANGGADRILREWWSWRDRDAWEMYWFAHDVGATDAPSLLVREMQRRIADDPRLVERLLLILNHDLPPSKLLSMRELAGMLSSVLRKRSGQRRLLLREAGTLMVQEAERMARSPPVRRRLAAGR